MVNQVGALPSIILPVPRLLEEGEGDIPWSTLILYICEYCVIVLFTSFSNLQVALKHIQ